MSKKLLFHSNAPWAPTGYGQQAAMFLPFLSERYETAFSALYGLEGSPIRWEGTRVLPGLGGLFGNETIPVHAERWFGGDPRDGLVLTLMDVWPLDPDTMRGLNMACWCPVDHTPAPPKVTEFFVRSEAVPIAMTRFGQEHLAKLDPLYVPHGVDTRKLVPLPQDKVRGNHFPDGAFVIGMVAANKGRPSRKSFAAALSAFATFQKQHENSFLYLHTTIDPNYGNGENIPALIQALGIPQDHLRIADQYALMYEPHSVEEMAHIYNAMDVLLCPSLGEGFGVPIIEAHACGVPAIVTDNTAMSEVCGAGWKIGFEPFWTGLSSWQGQPHVHEIVSALEDCWSLSDDARAALAKDARHHVMQYDVNMVWKHHFLPALKTVEQRFDARKPITIPARQAKVAA